MPFRVGEKVIVKTEIEDWVGSEVDGLFIGVEMASLSGKLVTIRREDTYVIRNPRTRENEVYRYYLLTEDDYECRWPEVAFLRNDGKSKVTERPYILLQLGDAYYAFPVDRITSVVQLKSREQVKKVDKHIEFL